MRGNASLLRSEYNYIAFAMDGDTRRHQTEEPKGKRIQVNLNEKAMRLLRAWRNASPADRRAATEKLDEIAREDRLKQAGVILPGAEAKQLILPPGVQR